MEETKCFCYTFSKETTEKIINGEAYLSPGGVKAGNGRMLEFGRPLILSKGKNNLFNLEEDEKNRQMIAYCNKQLDLYERKLEGIQKSLWFNNATLQQMNIITLDGFSCIIDRIDTMSDDIKTIQKSITEKHQNERLRELLAHIAGVTSDIDYMSIKSFNASSNFITMKNDIGEIMSFLAIVNKEFLDGQIDGKLALLIISSLLQPYAILVKSYSALYFYENGKYPMAYENWVEIINEIAKSEKFRNRIIYWARLEIGMSLDDKLIACKQIVRNLCALENDLLIDREYALTHSKEEYLGRKKKIIEKITNKEFEIIDGHLFVTL